MRESLETALKRLRLSGLAGTLEVRLQEAAAGRLSHEEFLELLLQDENKSVKRDEIYELATGRFIREAGDVLFIGPPGVGKSHLVQAIGYAAIKSGSRVLYRSIFDLVREFVRDEAFDGEEQVLARYLKPDLLIVDDMGMKQLPKRSGEYLFEIVMRRYENRSTVMTSNRPIEEWGKLIGDVPAAGAILDRFLHHALIVTMNGKSYRLRNQACKAKPKKA